MGAQHAAGVVNEDAATKLVVASLYFLRFVIPALVSPRAFRVIDVDPPVEMQRALVLVGKVLQCTASGVEFDGSKEIYMGTTWAFGFFCVRNRVFIFIHTQSFFFSTMQHLCREQPSANAQVVQLVNRCSVHWNS